MPLRGPPAGRRGGAPATSGPAARAGESRECRLKAALTGGTGFVGGHLAEALAAHGADVSALVRSPARCERLRALGSRLVEGDLDDEAALARLVKSRDVVFHVAGLVAARSAADFLRANRDGARRVAEAAAREGVGRLVLVSSLAVTGPSPAGGALDESSGPGPLTAYGRSKQAGEEAVRDTGVPVTIVRPPAVYGPRDRAFLNVFRTARRRGRAPPRLGRAEGDARARARPGRGARRGGRARRRRSATSTTPATRRRCRSAGWPRPWARRSAGGCGS